MGDITHYKRTFDKKCKQFNKPAPLVDYLGELITTDTVRIAELGAGPVVTIGNEWPNTSIEIVASDEEWVRYSEMWQEEQLIPIEYQNMEALTYPDDSFDIVHCRNALDHTPNAYQAVAEMQRVCKPGGHVVLLHAESQKEIYGGHHYHNIEDLDLDGFTLYKEGKWYKHVWQK